MLELTFFVLLVFQMMDPFKASETFKKLVGINGSKLKNKTYVKTEFTRLTNVNIHYEKTTIASFWKNLNNPIDKSILCSIICVLILLALVTAVIVCISTEIKKQSHRKRGKKNQKKEQPKLKKKPTITISSSTGKKQISSTESIETSAQ